MAMNTGFDAITAVEPEVTLEEIEEPEVDEPEEMEEPEGVEVPGEVEAPEAPEELEEGGEEGCRIRPPRGRLPTPKMSIKFKSTRSGLKSGSRPRGGSSRRQQQRPRNSSTLRTEENYENESLISAEMNNNQAYRAHEYQATADSHRANDNRISFSSGANEYEIPQVVPKKDKIFIVNVKRFVMSSMGVPGIPQVSTTVQTISSLFGFPFYFLLLIWGIILCTCAAIELAEIHCQVLKPVFALTACVGAFFILLWLFWALVFWWSKASNTKLVSFSLIVILWFVLCFVSVAVTSSLTTLIIVHHQEVFNTSSADDDCNSKAFFRYTSVTAVGSVSALWIFQLIAFLINVCNCCNACKQP